MARTQPVTPGAHPGSPPPNSCPSICKMVTVSAHMRSPGWPGHARLTDNTSAPISMKCHMPHLTNPHAGSSAMSRDGALTTLACHPSPLPPPPHHHWTSASRSSPLLHGGLQQEEGQREGDNMHIPTVVRALLGGRGGGRAASRQEGHQPTWLRGTPSCHHQNTHCREKWRTGTKTPRSQCRGPRPDPCSGIWIPQVTHDAAK